MNLGQLASMTYFRAGVSTADAMLTPDIIGSLVNDANHYVATVHDWPWQQVLPVSFSTVAGQQNYSVPGNWLRTVDLRVTGPQAGDGLTLYSTMELDDRWPAQITGQPRAFAIYGDTLRIAPAPDGVYTIGHRYIKVEADLVTELDVPIMPAQFHPCLAEYAAYLALRRISEEQRAGAALAAFQGADGRGGWIGIMLQDRKRNTAPQRIRVRPGNIV